MSKVFINLHIEARKPDINIEKLKEMMGLCNKNVKIIFEHLPTDNFISFVNKYKDIIGMTYDTAHIFGSGYKIEDLITLNIKPVLIHLNGSLSDFGSKNDVHTSLAGPQDKIWDEELLSKFLLKFKHIPMILERRNLDDVKADKALINKLM